MVVHAGFLGGARRLAIVAAVASTIGLAQAPVPAHAGGIGTGAAVGIGLGAFALGTMAANPYYYGAPGYYPGYAPSYYYPPAPAYYPGYYAPRSCWNPYYGRYYAC